MSSMRVRARQGRGAQTVADPLWARPSGLAHIGSPLDRIPLVAKPLRRKASLLFTKEACQKLGQRLQALNSVWSFGCHRYARTFRGAQCEKTHDGAAADRLTGARHSYLSVEAFHCLNELGGGAGMQALAVDYGKLARKAAAGYYGLASRGLRASHGNGYLPAKTLDATLMYLRPASWA